MAFVVEDGTGLDTANSLVDVDYANAYFLERGDSVWTNFLPSDKEKYLVLATDYFEMRYSQKLKNIKFLDMQALSFPRVDVYSNTIPTPTNIKKAICEYAVRAKAGLIKDVASDAVTSLRVKIGDIERETNFASNSKSPELYNSFPTADLWVKPYLKSSSNCVIR